MTGTHLNAYVSFPRGDAPPDAEEWEDAIARRVPQGRAMVVIVDRAPKGGGYVVRSAHLADGSVGDITPDAVRILNEAGFDTRQAD